MALGQTVERHVRFLEVDDGAVDALQPLKAVLDSNFDELLDRFYGHLLGEPEVASLFTDAASLDRARRAQKRYWLEHIFAKRFDREQGERAEEIANAHLRIGLEPSWYMSSYCFMLNRFVEQASECHGDDVVKMSATVQALNKVIFLDMNVVTDMYLEAKNASMRELLRRATIFSEDMKRLSDDIAAASADLQARIDATKGSTELSAAAARVSSRVDELMARLAKFRSGDRLETRHHRQRSGWVSRARRLFRSRT